MQNPFNYKKKGETMKKIGVFFTFILIASFVFANQTQVIEYSNSWGKQGFDLKFQSSSEVEVNHSIQNFVLQETEINGEMLQTVLLPGNFLPNDEGMPNLPGNGRYIAIPQGASAELRILDFRTELYTNIDLSPAPRIPLDTEDGPLEYNKNESVYSRNEYYPVNSVQLGEQTQIRGVDVVMLGITPFQYNPVTKELLVYKDLKIEVSFIGGNGHFGEDRLRNRWWDPLLHDMVLNEQSLPEITFNYDFQNREDGAEYLIICPDDPIFLAWADSIRIFRNQQGISSIVVTTTEAGGNTPTAIEDYIDDAYDNWDPAPAAVLLLGDYGTTGNSVVSPIYNNYCASDNIFADVSGNMLPDIVFARMTAQNETHLETMVTKFLDYERNPPTNPDFYDHPITALGWQTERWFQICSESIGGFWHNELGKDQVRINAIYQGNPMVDPWSTNENTYMVTSYFGPSGLGYIPYTPAELGGWTGGNAAMINNAINSGAFVLQHRDHGSETGWGEPDYNSNHINGLTNTDLVYVFSINCLTGKFNITGECFAEKFHRYTHNGYNSGALGLIAASEVSYSFVNDTFIWGAYDNMWPQFMPDYGNPQIEERGILPAFGNASGKYFLQQSGWPSNPGSKAVTYNLFHHHGDAFSTVFSEMPQNLTVSHDDVLESGMTSFEVTADDGSLIGLSVNSEVIGVGNGTGSPVSIQIPAQPPGYNLLITVTNQNYYRYSAEIPIIPFDGGYIVIDSLTITDENGNSDGECDAGEEILLTYHFRNVGNQPEGIVLFMVETDTTYLQVEENFLIIDGLDAGETSLIDIVGNISFGCENGQLLTVIGSVMNMEGAFIQTDYIPVVKLPKINVDLEYISVQLEQPEIIEYPFIIENIGAEELICEFINNSNQAADLSATDSYLSIPHIEDYNDLSEFTVMAWLYIPENGYLGYVLNKGSSFSESSFAITILNLNFITCYFWDASGNRITLTANVSLSEEQWNHVAVTVSETNIKFYFNGNFVSEVDFTSPIFSTEDMIIVGAHNSGSFEFDGYIDELSFFNSYLEESEIQEKMQMTVHIIEDNLISNYRFDADSGLNDLTGNNNAVSVGDVTFDALGANITTWFGFPESVITVPAYESAQAVLQFNPIGYPEETYSSSFSILSNSAYNNEITIPVSLEYLTSFENNTVIKKDFDLHSYPNPFNPSTTFSFSIPNASRVELTIFNVKGQEVRTLISDDLNKGEWKITWDGKDASENSVGTGIYFSKLSVNGKNRAMKKVLLLK